MDVRGTSERYFTSSQQRLSPPYVSRHTITADKISKATSRGNLTFLRSSGCCHSTSLSAASIASPTLKEHISAKTVLRLQSFMPVFLKESKSMRKYYNKQAVSSGLHWQDCACKKDLQRSATFKDQPNPKGQRPKSFINSVSSLRCSSASSTSSSFPRAVSPDSDFTRGQLRVKRIQAWVEETL